jgi:hypothetical protein
VLAEDGVHSDYDVRFEREINLGLHVPETTDAAALLRNLGHITTATAQARRELARTLHAGWRVFHLECGIDRRIACYDPTYPHRITSAPENARPGA